MNREMRENLCDTCRKGCKVRREAIVSSCESYKAPKEAAKLKGEGTEEKPFNEKYGLEIAGKFVPFKDLPTDINELKDLIKKAEEKEKNINIKEKIKEIKEMGKILAEISFILPPDLKEKNTGEIEELACYTYTNIKDEFVRQHLIRFENKLNELIRWANSAGKKE